MAVAEDYVGAVGVNPASTRLLPAVPSELLQDQQDSLAPLLSEYQDIFSQADDNIGRTHLAEHTIHLQDPSSLLGALLMAEPPCQGRGRASGSTNAESGSDPPLPEPMGCSGCHGKEKGWS